MSHVAQPQEPETAVIDIATQLDEPASHVINQIQRIIEQVGVATAYDFLAKTQAVLAEGGILTQDKKRPRTPTVLGRGA